MAQGSWYSGARQNSWYDTSADGSGQIGDSSFPSDTGAPYSAESKSDGQSRQADAGNVYRNPTDTENGYAASGYAGYAAGNSGTREQAYGKRKRTGFKYGAIIACVLILIAATSYVFSDGDSARKSARRDVVPHADNNPSSDAEDSEEDFWDNYNFDEDFRDFFEDYYTIQGNSGSYIPRIETGNGPSMELHTRSDRETLDWQEVYNSAIDSIVSIRAYTDSSVGYYWGSGIILSEDGYILTNAHLIDGTVSATVITKDMTEYEALLVGEDSRSDLAILKIEASGLKSAEFGISDEMLVGDEVVAIGNPLGEEFTGTMTNGIISAINRDVTVDGRSMTLIQTTAAINEGNSGGPLLNHWGQVIGIVNMKMAARYSEVSIEGIGFAIPTSGAKEVVDRIMVGVPGIGITVGNIPEGVAKQYELPDGLYIISVQKGSDAAEKGLVKGDVVVKANGQTLSTVDELLDIKNSLDIGDTIVFDIFRDGKTFQVEVELVNMNDLY